MIRIEKRTGQGGSTPRLHHKTMWIENKKGKYIVRDADQIWFITSVRKFAYGFMMGAKQDRLT